MRVAITGGAGFVGSQLVQRLCEEGVEVQALCNRSPIEDRENLTVIRGGLDDRAAISQLLDGVDAVVHCAGLVAAKNKEDFFRVNAEATKQLADFAAERNVPMLLVSTLAAKKPGISYYAASKKLAESYVKKTPKLQWDIVRPPAVYGEGDMRLLPLFRLLKYRVGLLPAGHEAQVSLIYVKDLVNAICQWLSELKPSQGVYELDDGMNGGYRWPMLLEEAALIMEQKPPFFVTPPQILLRFLGVLGCVVMRALGQTPFVTPGKMRELCYNNWVADSEQFQNRFKWRPEYGFRRGFDETYTWYISNGHL